MIKRIRFATRRAGLSPAAFSAAWTHAVGGAAHAPREVRPLRLAVCTVLPGRAAPHDGVGTEWFEDAAHLRRFEDWLAGCGGAPAGPVVVAEERVLRGSDWLERRWKEAGPRLKHMAVALRAEGLSSAEFSAQWRAHAGSSSPGQAIPEAARGQAYAQNLPLDGLDQAYDAVNEVYFDKVEDLRRRVEWFRTHPPEQGLFRAWWFLPVRERLIRLPD